LNGYTNANMTGDVDSRKSTSSYMMTFGRKCHGNLDYKNVILSSTKEKFIIVTKIVKGLLWM